MQNKISLVIFMIMMSSFAFAGPSSSGGGMSVTCRDAGGKVISTELLDVYEAKLDPKRTVMNASGSFEEDYLRLSQNTYRLQGFGGQVPNDGILKNLKAFMSHIRWVQEDETLPFLNDQGDMPALPAHCELEQVAIFYDSGEQIAVRKDSWLRMDSLNRAALVQHELFYKLERLYDENTSESTRSYVRQIVSIEGNTPVKHGSENATSDCWGFAREHDRNGIGDVTHFFVHRTPNDLNSEDAVLQFTFLSGRALLVKTVVEIPNFIFDVTRNGIPKTGPAKQLRLPVLTSHRNDWEIFLKYEPNEPVRLTLLQDGVPIGVSKLYSCSDI